MNIKKPPTQKKRLKSFSPRHSIPRKAFFLSPFKSLKMNAHYFFFAINLNTAEVECFATKYLPTTNQKGSRFKFWQINAGFETIGKPITINWSYSATSQQEQLQEALGSDWKVLSLYQACTRISSPSK
jgi:hypothetical protein